MGTMSLGDRVEATQNASRGWRVLQPRSLQQPARRLFQLSSKGRNSKLNDACGAILVGPRAKSPPRARRLMKQSSG